MKEATESAIRMQVPPQRNDWFDDESAKPKPQMDGRSDEGCRGWGLEIGGSRPRTEVVGGGF